MGMSNEVTTPEAASPDRLERERAHFNKIVERDVSTDLLMPPSNVRRYDRPPEDTPFPMEYAFCLLGDVRGKVVVDLGCGEGLNTVVLASLGAQVISVDISDRSLELTGARAAANGVARNVTLVHSDAATIPVQDGVADRVLCATVLHHVDCLATARQIRRILKPGALASFLEPVAGPEWLATFRSFLPKPEGVSRDERPLTMNQIDAVSRAVGRAGRRRQFLLLTRLLHRGGINVWPIVRRAHHMDAWILRRLSFAKAFASPAVWEARKEC